MTKQEINDELHKIAKYLNREAKAAEGSHFGDVLEAAALDIESLHDDIAEDPDY